MRMFVSILLHLARAQLFDNRISMRVHHNILELSGLCAIVGIMAPP